MAKPMFFYTGVYDNVADADADYEAIKSLHKGGAIGSYDSAVIVHTPDGDVKVTKTEKPTQKGGVDRPRGRGGRGRRVPVPASGGQLRGHGRGRGRLGAWFGHRPTERAAARARVSAVMLAPGKAALIVIGIDKDAEQIERALTRAEQHVLERDVGDGDEAEQVGPRRDGGAEATSAG